MKQIYQNITETPISFTIFLIYGLWWVVGIVFFRTYDFNTNVSGGIVLMSFLICSFLISALLLIGFLIAQKKHPDKQTIYQSYVVSLGLPYLLIATFFGFHYAKTLIANRYQEDLTEFNFVQSDIRKKLKYESTLNSIKIETKTEYTLSNSLFPKASKSELAQPVIFQRKHISLIPLEIDYYFGEKDSIVKCVLYNWDGNYPYPKVTGLNDDGYRNKYKAILANLRTRLGAPSSQNGDFSKYTEGEFETIWKTNEITITLRIYLSITTKRIRCTTYWNQ